MSKLAYKKPEARKSAVSISKNVAEIWYSKPVLLGKIEFIGNKWYCEDGTQFLHNRAAMDYVIKMHEAGHELRKMRLPTEQEIQNKKRARKVGPNSQLKKQANLLNQLVLLLQQNPDLSKLIQDTEISKSRTEASLPQKE